MQKLKCDSRISLHSASPRETLPLMISMMENIMGIEPYFKKRMKRLEKTMQVASITLSFQFISTYWETGMSHEHINHLKPQLAQTLSKGALRLQPEL